MALSDLSKDVQALTAPSSSSSRPSTSGKKPADTAYTDEPTEAKLVEMVLKLLVDENAEVKSSAVTWSAHMVFGDSH